MKLIVCMKQVPAAATASVDPLTNTIVRTGQNAVTNPFDLYALQAALDVREKTGGTVTALTMGIPAAQKVLRDASAHTTPCSARPTRKVMLPAVLIHWPASVLMFRPTMVAVRPTIQNTEARTFSVFSMVIPFRKFFSILLRKQSTFCAGICQCCQGEQKSV